MAAQVVGSPVVAVAAAVIDIAIKLEVEAIGSKGAAVGLCDPDARLCFAKAGCVRLCRQ